jgi:hypothetical protein
VALLSWKKDEHLLPYVPAAYFDKAFCNLRYDKAAADDLLDRVAGFVDEIDDADSTSLLAGAADYDRLMIPGDGGVPLPPAVLQDRAANKPYARVTAKILATDSTLGATTHFKPLRAENPTVAEWCFWALWDWMILSLLGLEEYDVLAASLNSFEYQLHLYRAGGMPSTRQMGIAPLQAVIETGATQEL